MNTTKILTAALITSALFTGSAIASNYGQDVEEDMINGHGMVKASAGEPYIYANPVANELQGVLLSNPSEYTHDDPMKSFNPVAARDNHDDNQSILHVPEES